MTEKERLEYELFYAKTEYNNLKIILQLRGLTMSEDEMNRFLDLLTIAKQKISYLEENIKDLGEAS